jgi:hypothetical protein
VTSRAQSDKRIRAVVAAVGAPRSRPFIHTHTRAHRRTRCAGGDASSIFGPVASISQWECYKANMDAYEVRA